MARELAEASGKALIEIADRDMDVSLSALGIRQARALGRWFGVLDANARPTVMLSSPYVRATESARLIADAANLHGEGFTEIIDERLREKEFGALNKLTKAGILAQFPEQAELRAHIGKFYYRPPSGESWCDVVLRLRSVLDQIQLQWNGERVLIVAHQVIVLCFRYIIERMTEQQLLAIDAAGDIANCGVTAYRYVPDARGRGNMALDLCNHVTPLEDEGETVTAQPDVPVAPR